MLHIEIVEARGLAALDAASAAAPSAGPELLPSGAAARPGQRMFVSVTHGSQAERTGSCAQTRNPVFNSRVEIWDAEIGETIEFTVLLQNGRSLKKHSITTVKMEDFRAQPEKRFDLVKTLSSLNPGTTPDTNSGELRFVATYTEDCFQPTLFQSLFCNAVTMGHCSAPDQQSRARDRAYQRSMLRLTSEAAATKTT